MKTPLISVIIPTYNTANYLPEAINSVRNQSYKCYEIIVVDDGSVDNTKEIIDSYIKNGVIKYFFQENRGPGAARNLGIKMACGDYITFLDADDSLVYDSLEKRIKLMNNTPGLRIVFSNYYVHSTTSTKNIGIDNYFLYKWKNVSRTSCDGIVIRGDFSDLFEIPFYIWTGSIILEKSIFQEIGFFRTDAFIGEDRDMWIKAIEHSTEVGYVDSLLAHYNKYRSNLTKENPENYAKTREQFNLSLFEKYGDKYNKRKISRVINSRLSWIYYDLAVHYSNENRKKNKYLNIFKSIYYNPRNWVAYRFLALSTIPVNIKSIFKRLNHLRENYIKKV